MSIAVDSGGGWLARTEPNLTITTGMVTAAAGADAAAGPNKGTYNVAPAFSLSVPANAYRSNYSGTVGSSALNPYTSTFTLTIA